MSIVTAAYARIYVGSETNTSGPNVLADYTADTWTEVGQVQDLGKFGSEAKEVAYTTLANNQTYRLKGTQDSGSFDLVCARDPDDVGQSVLRTAAASEYLPRRFKVELADKPAGGTTNTIFYFKAITRSAQSEFGKADKEITQTFSVGISGNILEVEAA